MIHLNRTEYTQGLIRKVRNSSPSMIEMNVNDSYRGDQRGEVSDLLPPPDPYSAAIKFRGVTVNIRFIPETQDPEVDDDLQDLRYVEAEFPAIVIDDAFAPQDAEREFTHACNILDKFYIAIRLCGAMCYTVGKPQSGADP
ncbi:hypothetical protein Tco_0191194 [Tanacetum coccineum]